MLTLPNVQIVRRRGKSYFYYVANRNTSYEGSRIPLGHDPTDPEFMRRYKEARGDVEDTGVKSGSFSALIAEYKNSMDFARLSPNTKRDYNIYLKRIEATWGNLLVGGLTTIGIIKLRDSYSSKRNPLVRGNLSNVPAPCSRTSTASGISR